MSKTPNIFWDLHIDSDMIFNSVLINFISFCNLRGGSSMKNASPLIVHPKISFSVHHAPSTFRILLIANGYYPFWPDVWGGENTS